MTVHWGFLHVRSGAKWENLHKNIQKKGEVVVGFEPRTSRSRGGSVNHYRLVRPRPSRGMRNEFGFVCLAAARSSHGTLHSNLGQGRSLV